MARMVGMELFNGGADYGARGGDGTDGWYAQALDRGWHIGAIGAEDAHDAYWGTPGGPQDRDPRHRPHAHRPCARRWRPAVSMPPGALA